MTGVQHTVRNATPADFAEMRSWLKREHDKGLHGSFWCHVDLLERGQREGTLTALVDVGTDRAVGFCLASGDSLSVFAIRHDLRRKGLGKVLAGRFIAEAERAGLLGLYGDCKPKDSLGFWRRVGFREVAAPPNIIRVALPFRRVHEFPANLPRSIIRIEMLDESRIESIAPAFKTEAIEEDGIIRLETEFVEYLTSGDTRIRIALHNGRTYEKKAKYADDVGVEWEFPWVRVRELEFR
jgi:GNAT superfamily N-acetyltransferase